MTDLDDMTLLRAWAKNRSETAFRAVVERYAGLVFGVALRRAGERALAEEVVQNVFTDLARKAAVIVELQRPLGAWLHRCAVYESATLVRGEIRHREKMKRFSYTPADEPEPDPWREILPHLDGAIDSLPAPDRAVLMAHWFERRTFAEIAHTQGGTAGAAQRRGLRALEKLAALLRRKGVAVPVAVLAAGLTPRLAEAAPAGLVNTVSLLAAKATPAAGGFFFPHSLHVMASAKLTTAAVVLISAAIPVSVHYAADFSTAPRPGPRGSGIHTANTPKAKGPVSAGETGPLDLDALRLMLQRLRNAPDDTPEIQQLARLMFTLEPEEIPAVREILLEYADAANALAPVLEACFVRWSELEPEKATATAHALQPRFWLVAATFPAWASSDFPSAWSWMESHAAQGDWWMTGNAAVKEVTKRDPMAAIALWEKTTRADMKEGMPRVIMEQWAGDDLDAATTWAGRLPDDALRTKLTTIALEAAGKTRPAAALSRLDRLDNAAAQGEAAWNITWPRALRAPEEVYAEMTANGAAWPDRVAYGIGDAMARHDAARAAEAAAALPAGAKRNEFVQGVLTGVSYTDPGQAAGVLELIPDSELMAHGGLNSFISAWAAKDPLSAARWIEALPADDPFHKKAFATSHFEARAGQSVDAVLKKGGAQ